MRMMNGEKTSLALMKSRDERLSKDERLALRFNYLDLSFPQLTFSLSWPRDHFMLERGLSSQQF